MKSDRNLTKQRLQISETSVKAQAQKKTPLSTLTAPLRSNINNMNNAQNVEIPVFFHKIDCFYYFFYREVPLCIKLTNTL